MKRKEIEVYWFSYEEMRKENITFEGSGHRVEMFPQFPNMFITDVLCSSLKSMSCLELELLGGGSDWVQAASDWCTSSCF